MGGFCYLLMGSPKTNSFLYLQGSAWLKMGTFQPLPLLRWSWSEVERFYRCTPAPGTAMHYTVKSPLSESQAPLPLNVWQFARCHWQGKCWFQCYDRQSKGGKLQNNGTQLSFGVPSLPCSMEREKSVKFVTSELFFFLLSLWWLLQPKVCCVLFFR